MSDTAKKIVEGMAYELWAQALAGYCIDHRDDERWAKEYDDLVYKGRGSVPDAAMRPAMELANLYEIANGMTLVQILEHIRRNPWGDLDDTWLSSPFEVGYLLAGMAVNHPWNWPAESKLEPVHIDISFTGTALVWDGDISPKTNPAKYDEVLREKYGDNTTIVIERGDHGYSAWLESNTGGRLPISFGRERPTNGREALSAAKRFLAGVHGKNNPAAKSDEWQSGYAYGRESALHETYAQRRDALRKLTDGARSPFEKGMLAAYRDLMEGPRPYERFPCTACGGQGPHDGPGHAYTTQPTPGKGLHEHECAACGGRGTHDGPGHAYTTHPEENPAGGPTRSGEQSRFRSTARGFGRTTAVIPRARAGADAPELSYDRWSVELGRAAAKVGTPVSYGTNTHDAWKAGKTPEQYARELKRMGAEKARKLR